MTSESPVPVAVLESLPSAAARDGRVLLRAGAVLAAAAEALDGMLVITGRVAGGEDAPFRCWAGASDGDLDADCSCGARAVCAHVAAVVLAASGEASAAPGGGHEGPDPGAGPLVAPTGEVGFPAAANLAQGAPGLLLIVDLVEPSGGKPVLALSAVRRARVAGHWMETPYALDRARETRQPGYVGPRHLEWLRHALAQGQLEGDGLRLRLPAATTILSGMVDALDCRWHAADGPRLYLRGARGVPWCWRDRQDGALALKLDVSALADVDGNGDGKGDSAGVLLPVTPPLWLDQARGDCLRLHAQGLEAELSDWLVGLGWVAPERIDELCRELQSRAGRCLDEQVLPPSRPFVEVSETEPEPVLCLEVWPRGAAEDDAPEQARARLVFDYGPARFRAGTDVATALLPGDPERPRVARVRRNEAAERAAASALDKAGLQACPDQLCNQAGCFAPAGSGRVGEAWVQVQLALGELRESGWRVEYAPGFPFRLVVPERWYGFVARSGTDEFELELGAELDGRRWPLLDQLLAWLDSVPASWLRHLLSTEHPEDGLLLRIDETRLARLPARQLRASLMGLVEWAGGGALEDGRLRQPLARISGLSGLEQCWALEGAPDLTGLVRRLGRIDALEASTAPSGFRAELRDYQRRGLAWLQLLREYGFGGVLADDMGLGKTLQTLAHLLLEKQSGRMDRPCLIVAPASLLFNWRAEARRFAPDLRLLTLHGPERKRHFHHLGEVDLVLTSYALMVRDHRRLAAQSFHAVVLDEAQAIKNPASITARRACELNARQRIALSGTPLENHLGELWSLFRFAQPGLLGPQATFEREFRKPIERAGDPDPGRLKVLRHIIAPFLLRRTKAAVTPELPPVVEIERVIDLEPEQWKLYEAVRLAMHDKVRNALDKAGVARGRMVVLDALLRLRQICCDPRLIRTIEGHDSLPATHAGSAKLTVLIDMLAGLCDEGRQVLVFSQFTSMLKLIELELQKLGLEYVTLTGRTRDRARPVQRFQNGEVPVFLISLKAGGAGLNLTAADAVIHYDPWWNPAAEDQATGRAHRIGQTARVFSWRLVTAGTVEQRVLELQRRKRELVEGLLTGAGGFSLDENDIEALFAPLETGRR